MDAALDDVRAALAATTRARGPGSCARPLALLEAARAGGGADRAFVELEIAGSWSVGQATATRLLVEAEQCTTCLPATLAALETGGAAGAPGAGAAARHPQRRPAAGPAGRARGAGCRRSRRRCARRTCGHSSSRVLLRLESEAVEAGLADARHEQAAAQRRTWARADADGMGVAGAVLTAEQLVAWKAGLDALEAQDRRHGPGAGCRPDRRPAPGGPVRSAAGAGARGPRRRPDVAGRGQQRAGASAGGAARARAAGDRAGTVRRAGTPRRLRAGQRRARPVDAPGRLPPGARRRRHRPSGAPRRPAHAACRTTRERCWEQLRAELQESLAPTVVVDRAETGHDPSARLGRLVDVRDRRCSGPGCGQTRTHRDHAEPWPTGPTAAWNLQRLSARCHRAKHTGWTRRPAPRRQHHLAQPPRPHLPATVPHAPPPQVDLHTEPPPRRARPAPTPPPPVMPTAPTPPPTPPPEHPVLPDDPPF